jgi:hypothetical protein
MVWSEIIELADVANAADGSHISRLGKFLLRLRSEMLGAGDDLLQFQYHVDANGELRPFSLYVTLLPGDDLEPVITVLQEGKD